MRGFIMYTQRSSQSQDRMSLDVEEKKLLQYLDRNEDDAESDCNSRDALLSSTTRRSRQSTINQWLLCSAIFLVSTVLGGILGYGLNKGCTEKQCVRMTSSYSPMLDVVEYYDYQFQAELGTENVYKGHPRPELDAAWDRIGEIHPMPMDESHREELNKTHSGIPYPEEQGGGIMVEIEVFHQLHCMNFLRKVIYADYYSRPENLPRVFEVSDKMMFNHVDHCIDYLRQAIMCYGDVTPVTSNWVLTHHSPHPDFNTMHKCRNFDKLLEWAESHDQGGVPRQEPNPSWWPAPKLADTVMDFEPHYPIMPHGPPVNNTRDMR